MDANKILSADILDILFEGRNKDYGAYDLRRSYRKRVYLALIIMVIACLLIFAVSVLASNKKEETQQILVQDVQLEDVKKEEEKKPEPPPPPPPPKVEPPKVEIAKFTPPKIVKDEEVKKEDELKENKELETVKTGTFNQEGEKDLLNTAPPPESSGTGTGVPTPAKTEDYDKEFKTVQIQAKFPGGDGEWRKYLERNLNRDLPVENGAPPGNYTVVVSFLVDKDGSISEVKSENSPGYGTAEEAVRVIKKGPKWIPAVQNGRNVIYRQRQSITFQVAEE
ncbi:outer membrane transport energization protein TonB [Filimonas lacunae]|uniref:Outer membrane transport energization protein TonB n=1 Tax=Filimonas lacunae TaxID=477680 RepID=A0A173MN87_9BACT|nr:energy transducer TonB [Filimonas lacunae]BAV08947.1 ferric siderophore transport system, periplasmic binding protein TonB [Filimonas lacunae]SIS64533.1 outer membrane transport energization protein TonB [Filimonas lacunae]